jgi:hypothetical protein
MSAPAPKPYQRAELVCAVRRRRLRVRPVDLVVERPLEPARLVVDLRVARWTRLIRSSGKSAARSFACLATFPACRLREPLAPSR